MRKLLILLLIATSLFAQSKKKWWDWYGGGGILDDSYSYGQSVNLDGSSEYASVTPSLRLTGTYSLSDDFSDGNYTGWTVSSGAYAVDNSVANPLSTNQYSLVCNTAGAISIPCNQAYGSWEFDWYKANTSNEMYMMFFKPDINPALFTGYTIWIRDIENLQLNRWGFSGILTTAAPYISNTTWYRIKITRNTNGQFYVYIKGGAFGSDYVLVSVTGGSGTNPVIDNTYTSSNYFVLDLDAGDRISNIVCEYGEGSLDLNGWERVKNSADRDFEVSANITWAGNGNHSLAQSSTDKKTGTYSMAVTSTSAGDATTNYISLPSASKVDLVAGEKYTVEAWARGTGVLGTELITNAADRDFSSDTGFWSKGGTGISIADSVCHFTATSLYAELRRANLTTIGKVYKVVYTVNGYSAGQIFANIGTNGTIRTGNGTYTDYILASGTTLVFGCGAVSTTLNIDDITIKEITLPSITLAIGGQSKTIPSISCVPATFTRVRWEIQATQAEVGQVLKLWVNQADVIYWDDFTIRKANDRVKSVWFKTSTTGTKKSLVSRYASSIGMHLYITTGNKLECIFSDGTTTATITGNTTVTDNTWRLATITVDRVGNMNLYLNGVADATAVDVSGLGAISTTANLSIGFNSADYFNGLIGETQIIRCSDLAQSNVNTSTLTQAYKGGLGTWTNGIVVGWWKFRGTTDSQMLRDYSNSGNSLSGTNLTTADQERGAYPSK